MRLRASPPIHPGEILREDFLAPLEMSAGQLAKALKVPRTRIERLIREETRVTADTAKRLGRFFRSGPEVWINLQTSYDLDSADLDAGLQAELDAITPIDRPDLGEAA